jgi:hypothetical protein
MTPEQIKNVDPNVAPDFLKVAAINARNSFQQQAQQPAPPTTTVAENVIAQSVGAAPQMPPQGVPGMDAAPQMPPQMPPQGAQAGGYIHDLGVASLPYTPKYEHGGIVSFDGTASGSYVDPYAVAQAKLDALLAEKKAADLDAAKFKAGTWGSAIRNVGSMATYPLRGLYALGEGPLTALKQYGTLDEDYYKKTGEVRSELADPNKLLIPENRFNLAFQDAKERQDTLNSQVANAKSDLERVEASFTLPPKPEGKAKTDDVAVAPVPPKSYADYVNEINRTINGPTAAGIPGAAAAAGTTAAGIPKESIVSGLGIEGAPKSPGHINMIDGPKNMKEQMAADKEDMLAQGIDPDAELKRQQGVIAKNKLESDKFLKEGKSDLLIALGANIMAGKSGNALTNIGEGLKGTMPQLAEFRKQAKEDARLNAAAEEEANKAAYAAKLGLYSQARAHQDKRDEFQMQANIHNASMDSAAWAVGVNAKEAMIRQQMQLEQQERLAGKDNTLKVQALALEAMKLDKTIDAELTKARAAMSENVIKNLLGVMEKGIVAPKEYLKSLQETASSPQVMMQEAAWFKDHDSATPEQRQQKRMDIAKATVDTFLSATQMQQSMARAPMVALAASGYGSTPTLEAQPE